MDVVRDGLTIVNKFDVIFISEPLTSGWIYKLLFIFVNLVRQMTHHAG